MILDCKDKKILNIFVGLVAELNMWSRVCDLLVAKPDLNHLDMDGLSVLHRLVMCPDSRFDSLLLLLLENKANINNKTSKGDSVLHLAAKHQKVLTMDQPSPPTDRDVYRRLKFIAKYVNKRAESKRQLLRRLIKSCDSFDDCDDQGTTAVMLAAKNINWEFLKLLLANGARASHVDQHQRSLLHVRALYGFYMDPFTCQDLDLVTLCVNRGAEVNCVDCDGNSALHLAVQSKNWILCKSLIEHGADTRLMDCMGLNVLHRLALTEIQYTQDVCMLFPLICSRDTDLNTPSRTGNTVLNIAATKQNWSLVKCLLHLGVNINLCNIEGFTILHIAAMTTPTSQHGEQASPNDQSDLLDVFDFVVNKTVDLELPCSTGDTALNLAAKHENWIMARYLIEREANTNTLDSEGVHLIQRLIKGRTENSEILLVFNLCYHVTSAQSSDSVLQLAAQEENWMLVDHVLKSLGGNVDKIDSQGQTVLQRMATSRSKTFKEGASCPYVKTILGKSEHLDNHQVDLLIHLAASAGNIHVLHELLDRFDEVNRTDGQGFTVLHKVAQCCSSSSVNIIKRSVAVEQNVGEFL
ncbi:ankyrin-3-like [Pomacea canaliculata]|uniref:ankyrin-3-like n=1 Tax=Pomacea canaliculata TaxID=400727 RepID=UPI000D727756|nr:ankyrin-3-like [Pomacea canaliculata]